MPKALLQLDIEELSLLAASIENNPLKMSALLLPNCPQCQTTILHQISEWIINRRVVLESRAEGNSHIALVFDKVCYRIWQQLPGYARDLEIDIDAGAWLDRGDKTDMREARFP